MTLSRRTLLQIAATGGTALAAPLTAHADQKPPVRLRLETFVQDPQRVASLKRGVAVMKARPPSDPRSWFFQGAIHAVRADWVEAARARDPGIDQVDQARFWNACPHSDEISSADFLLWHRAYLYYFERILRDAAQDPALCVPYWNYTDRAQRRFPTLFAVDDPDPVTGAPRNPLFDLRREIAFMSGMYELSDAAVAVPAPKEFFGATESQGFGGGLDDKNSRDRGGHGEVEQSPHDLLHFAIGGAIQNAANDEIVGGLMGAVETAAFDPIFWVHHCNVDRLWSAWDCLPDREWGHSPPQSWFGEKPWSFYDYDRSVQNHPRAHYLRYGSLNIRFDTDAPGCTPLSGTLPYEMVAGGPTPTGAAAARRPIMLARQDLLGRSDEAVRLSATAPAVRSIPSTAPTVLGAPSPAEAMKAAPLGVQRRVFLRFEGIELRSPPSVRYDVYVNLADNVAPSRDLPAFVGSLALFGLTHAHGPSAHVMKGTQQFDITRLAMQPDFNARPVRISIIPVELLAPRQAGQPSLQRDGGVTVAGMQIVVAEGQP